MVRGGLIPKGTLREPAEHLSRAHIFILTKSNIGYKNLHWIRQRLLSIKPDAIIFEAVHNPVEFYSITEKKIYPIEELKHRRVAVISGIGDPHSFEKTVEKLTGQIMLAARFDDHHDYSRHEIVQFLEKVKKMGVQDIVTTEKDSFRMEHHLLNGLPKDLGPMRYFYLKIEFDINEEEDFIRRCANS